MGSAGFPLPPYINTPVKNFGAFSRLAQQQLKALELQELVGAADSIDPHTSANYMVNSSGVDAMVLAAPTAYDDDGKVLRFISTGAHAHTITATGLLKTGSASVNVATFAAQAGAMLALMAYQGLWYVLQEVGITFS